MAVPFLHAPGRGNGHESGELRGWAGLVACPHGVGTPRDTRGVLGVLACGGVGSRHTPPDMENQGHHGATETDSKPWPRGSIQARPRRGDGRESSDDQRTHEEVLGLKTQWTQEDLKTAYRRESQRLHPDKWIGKPEPIRQAMEAEYKRVQEAYRTLTRT